MAEIDDRPRDDTPATPLPGDARWENAGCAWWWWVIAIAILVLMLWGWGTGWWGRPATPTQPTPAQPTAPLPGDPPTTSPVPGGP